MKNILIQLEVEPTAVARLQALPDVAVPVLEPQEGVRELPSDQLRDHHIFLCHFPPRNFDDFNALELLQLATVGYEHLRHLGMADRPVRVSNARGVFETAIAEWNLGMMINLTRDLRGMIRNQEHGQWERPARFQREIRGQVVGLWGYGGIGRETARLAKACGMTVHVLSRFGVGPRRNTYALPGTGDPEGILPDRVFTTGQEHAFLSGLDFLVLASPRTARTTGIIGAAELQALPRTAFILNPARGHLIQEQALLTALREGWIAGAALDTHYAFPLPAEHPLWTLPNVIMTPHISGAEKSQHFLGRIWDLFVQNVERYLAGRPLLNELTAAEWREA
jgi:phosphoglycerate dehydrogenase-like enzyme